MLWPTFSPLTHGVFRSPGTPSGWCIIETILSLLCDGIYDGHAEPSLVNLQWAPIIFLYMTVMLLKNIILIAV